MLAGIVVVVTPMLICRDCNRGVSHSSAAAWRRRPVPTL